MLGRGVDCVPHAGQGGSLDNGYQSETAVPCVAHGFDGRFLITVMITRGMAKKPAPPASLPSASRRPGRPPKPGGRLPQVEIQRAYRARLAAAGKVVKIVDAATVSPALAHPALAAIPDFDPVRDGVYDRAEIEGMRERLHNALLKLEIMEREVSRLETRNAYLEGELRLQGQHHTNALKANIVLKQQLAEITQKPAKRRRA